MKKTFPLFFILLFFISCNTEIKPADISKINGYWEIEKVILPDGTDKKYTISESIDCFEIKNSQGLRKKAVPQLDGTYIDNGLAEKVSVIFKDGKAFLEYKTQYAKWQEEIIALSVDNLVLKNRAHLEYHYKRPVLFSEK